MDLPDIADIPPEEWLRRLDQIREQLVGELAELLRETDDPGHLAERLETAFSRLRQQTAGEDSNQMEIRVRQEGGEVICRHDGAQNARRLTRSGEDDCWTIEIDSDRQLEADIPSTQRERDSGDRHRRLARRLLELLPWWSKHAFTPRSRT